MKVRVIAGVRDVNLSDPLCGTWIELVSFPMQLTNYAYGGAGDPDTITVHDEDELVAWANTAFEPDGYEIWDMEIPPAVLGAPATDLGRRLGAIDREITAVSDAGAFTSELTAALDNLWRHLDGRAVVNTACSLRPPTSWRTRPADSPTTPASTKGSHKKPKPWKATARTPPRCARRQPRCATPPHRHWIPRSRPVAELRPRPTKTRRTPRE